MAQKTLLQIEGISSETLFKEFSKIIDARFLKVEQPKTDEDTFITRQNVADMLHVTLPTVHSWTNSGILKAYKIGKNTRFLLSEVKAAATKKSSEKEMGNE
jgi:excisionase family DNA binding protein